MKYSYEYFKAFDDNDKSVIDTMKMNERDIDRLQVLQGQYRSKMARLKEIRDMDSTLTDEVRAERDVILSEVKEVCDEIDKFPRCDENGLPGILGNDGLERSKRGYAIRAAKEKKDFRSLFGAETRNSYRWTDQEASFYQAVFSGQFHPGLTKRSMSEGGSSDGGFLIPTEYSEQIHNVALENEIVLPRCTVAPMQTNEKHLPGMEIGSHASSLYGGFTASYETEGASLSEANPKVRDMILKAKKLTGFLKFSNELLADLSDSGEEITRICGQGLAWYRDRAFLKGSGAGEPLGILNSGCLIEVEAADGQVAGSLVYENLTEMMSRMYAGSFKNSVWICHQSTIPSLLSLSVSIGTSGSYVPVLTKGTSGFEILTRPVIFTEKTEPLGSKGDIILADLSQYVCGLREEYRLDFSPHLYFANDQTAARLISRHDGMPMWDEALTLEDGSTTVSPFITLEAR